MTVDKVILIAGDAGALIAGQPIHVIDGVVGCSDVDAVGDGASAGHEHLIRIVYCHTVVYTLAYHRWCCCRRLTVFVVDGGCVVSRRGVLPVQWRLRRCVAQIDFSAAAEDERWRWDCGSHGVGLQLNDTGWRTAMTAVAVDGCRRRNAGREWVLLVRVYFLRRSLLLLMILGMQLLLLLLLTAGMCESLVKGRVGCGCGGGVG